MAFATIRAGDVPELLLKAAGRLESIDAGLARLTYLQAVAAATFTDEVTRGDVQQIARAAAAAPRLRQASPAPSSGPCQAFPAAPASRRHLPTRRGFEGSAQAKTTPPARLKAAMRR